MLDLESETLILSDHGIFIIFRNNLNEFSMFTMVPMLVLLHPRHVFMMFRSSNVYKCFYHSTIAGASSSKPLVEAS
jgi:hypothetical protein